MSQKNTPISPLRTRSPSDCDERVFSTTPICGEPGKLQLIHPDDLLDMVDVDFSSQPKHSNGNKERSANVKYEHKNNKK